MPSVGICALIEPNGLPLLTGLGAVGPLLAAAFKLGTVATTAEQRIIVDNAHHMVSYDDDGSGVHAAVVITKILGNLTKLSEADFQII
jgi:serralysin